eukprot:5502807-Pleurochrysis_carterae.AAC.1
MRYCGGRWPRVGSNRQLCMNDVRKKRVLCFFRGKVLPIRQERLPASEARHPDPPWGVRLFIIVIVFPVSRINKTREERHGRTIISIVARSVSDRSPADRALCPHPAHCGVTPAAQPRRKHE